MNRKNGTEVALKFRKYYIYILHGCFTLKSFVADSKYFLVFP